MVNIKEVELAVRDRAIHCAGCEGRIEGVLKRLPGVASVKADHKTQKVRLALDPERVTVEAVKERLAAIGYETA